jgi:hypothetical protein
MTGVLRIFAETLGRMEMDEILQFLQHLPKVYVIRYPPPRPPARIAFI